MPILYIDYTDPSAPSLLAKSFRETGFAVLKKHTIPLALMEKTYHDWAVFFAQDEAEKERYLFNKKTQDGFFPKRIAEKAKGHSELDIKEYFSYYPWGRIPDSLKEVTHALHTQLTAMGKTLLGWLDKETPSDVAHAYAMPLSDMIEGSDKNLLRILHYPPLSGTEPTGAVRAAPHEDINLITLLPASNEPGLQVKDLQGQWHTLACDHGNLIINAGDMLQMCTEGYYPSTTHRVCNPRGEKARCSRYSTPLFLHPRSEVRLSKNYTADDYLNERLRELGVKS